MHHCRNAARCDWIPSTCSSMRDGLRQRVSIYCCHSHHTLQCHDIIAAHTSHGTLNINTVKCNASSHHSISFNVSCFRCRYGHVSSVVFAMQPHRAAAFQMPLHRLRNNPPAWYGLPVGQVLWAVRFDGLCSHHLRLRALRTPPPIKQTLPCDHKTRFI